VAFGIVAATAVIVVVSSLRTEAGNEALDFWLQSWGGERSHERAAAPPENPQLKITVTPRRSDREQGGGERESGGTYCVRTCDGYYFPLSSQRRSNSESRELCNSLCAGAATEVYQRRGGADASFAQAVSYKGKPYSKLANAFAFREKSVAACTCHSADKPSLAVTEDPTLQPGDIVVTGEGVKVFRGGKKRPYRDRDFADYRNDRNVSKTHRAFLDAVNRPFHTAQKAPAAERPHAAAAEKSSSRKSARRQHRRGEPAYEEARSTEAVAAFAQQQEKSP
jgi:hypothetical protein